MAPINIDYTTIDFDALKQELIGYLQETSSFSDVQYASSNINTLTQLFAYLGSLFGFYINSIANEPFLPSAKRYKNLNRIAKLLAYNPKGDASSQATVIGSLVSEYCLAKKNVYFEIPAYSIFPSNKQTPTGDNFSFTNLDYISYSVKSYGVRTVQISDFTYDGNPLPLTNPVSYWTASTTASPSFDPTKLTLNLSDTMPLSVMQRQTPGNYGYDPNVPKFDPTDATSVGQPFNRSISVNTNSLRIVPGVVYYIVFSYDVQTSKPCLLVMEEGSRLEELRDNVITSIRLDPTDATNQFYTINEVQNNSLGRFYVGVLGMLNLDSVSFTYDSIPSIPNSIQQMHLNINPQGTQPPFNVLIDGIVYTFASGVINSQIFTANTWDVTQPSYNVILSIVSPNSPEFNYDAVLNVTSSQPGINEVVIATIYPSYVDPETNISAIAQVAGQRFGNFQVVPPLSVESTEQKTGYVTFPENVTSIFVPFDTPFSSTPLTGDSVDYIVQLTPSDNVQVWFSAKSPTGFTINVAENTDFSGQVNWVATRFIKANVRTTNVTFTTPMPLVNEQNPDYTIFLTPSDNVTVWYTNKTPNGFNINVEKGFTGTVSYSTFVFSDDEAVIAEVNQSTQQKGTLSFAGGVVSKDVTLATAYPDVDYGLNMIADQNVNVWYTNKTTTGFTINVDSSYTGQVNIDWYADESPVYKYQKHGMIDFSGQVTNAGTLPGLRFTNIDETFVMPTLKQGDILFSHVDSNGNIDQSNNGLNIAFSTTRTNINDIKLQVQLTGISYTDIRVFVSNSAGDWEEWANGSSLIQSVDVNVGKKVFFVRFNEYKQIEISFGDGETFGVDPFGNEIIVFGLNTVGSAGNVPPNTIGPSIILSENIIGDTDVTIQFESQFIQLLGLKSQQFYSSNSQTSVTVIYDSQGSTISETVLKVIQATPAVAGGDAETTEELRANASMANLRQNRVVSEGDLVSFCNQAFSDYIIKTQVLTYKDIQNTTLLPPGGLAQYWFNYLFIVALPAYGNEITTDQRNFILNTLRTMSNSMATVEYELLSGQLTPIDFRILLNLTKTGNAASVESQINVALQDYFNVANHQMGELLEYGPIEKILLNVAGVDDAQMAMNKNPGNKLSPDDYIVSGASSPTQTVDQVKRNLVLQLLAKDPSLMQIINPTFSVTNTATNTSSWVFSQDIQMQRFEFPVLGNIIIEYES